MSKSDLKRIFWKKAFPPIVLIVLFVFLIVYTFALHPIYTLENTELHKGVCVSAQNERAYANSSGARHGLALVITLEDGTRCYWDSRLTTVNGVKQSLSDLAQKCEGHILEIRSSTKHRDRYNSYAVAELTVDGQILISMETTNRSIREARIAVSILCGLLISVDVLTLFFIYKNTFNYDKRYRKKNKKLSKKSKKLSKNTCKNQKNMV